MNVLSIIIVCLLYVYEFLILYITVLAKKKGEKTAFINNLANFLVLIFAITLNLLFVNYFNSVNNDFIVFPFDIFTVGFLILFYPIFYFFIRNEKRKIKKGKVIFEETSLTGFKKLPFKYDIYRKLTHLIVLTIILFYFTLGFWIQNIFVFVLQFFPKIVSEIFFSVFYIERDLMIFTQYLVVFLVSISLIGLLTAEFVRILKSKIYLLKPINRILREKELHMRLGPHISMAIGCYSIILLFGLFQPIGPLIICLSMTMSIFGDIASNLIGRTLGTKKIRNGPKTYEGLLAGIIGSFISGILILIILCESFCVINALLYFFLPLIGSIIIGVIDFLDLEIDDNLLYPFTISTVLFFILIFIA